MVLKVILLAICAALLFICYKTRAFARKILRLEDERITEALILKIKSIALAVSIALFICTTIFVK